jgi:hypothetical protein
MVNLQFTVCVFLLRPYEKILTEKAIIDKIDDSFSNP